MELKGDIFFFCIYKFVFLRCDFIKNGKPAEIINRTCKTLINSH
jgi:hypothetical protein